MSSSSSFSAVAETKAAEAPAVAKAIKRRGPFSTHVRQEVNVKYSGGELATLDFPVNLRNQNFALISYVGPKTIPASGGFALRIYGTFASYDEAEAAATKAMKNGYTLFDLDIVDIQHGFFPLPPPPDADVDLKYSNEKLAKIMDRHKNALNQASRRVMKRAEADATQETAAQEFERRVTQEALSLFKDWKKRGKSESHKIIKEKVAKKYGEFVKELQDDVQQGIENMAKGEAAIAESERAAANLVRKAETETDL